MLGPDTFITFINARVTEMLGYTMEEMIGRPVTDFMFAEDTPDYFRRIDSRQQGLLSDNYELRFRRKDGQELWAFIAATAILDEDGHFDGTFGMVDRHHRAQTHGSSLELP